MNRIAIFPARGGSVRIPRKNIKEFKGQPMMAWPIKIAQKSNLFDAIVVSTDHVQTAELAASLGCIVHWRAHDDGTRGTNEVARQVLMTDKYRNVEKACVIYPCSPLLCVSDLERGLAVLGRDGALFAMSVQTEPLADAGCFYWGDANAFRVAAPLIDSHTVMVPMPANRVCDINTTADWERAEALFERGTDYE